MTEYEFHPLADLFPLIDGEEFDALAADIKKNGLHEPITLFRGKILDGRNRHRALQRLGVQIGEYHFQKLENVAVGLGDEVDCPERLRNEHALAYVISKNIHRRHLSADQKRELVIKLLKAKPGASNNAIAKEAKVDDKTVAKVRRDLEVRSEIPNVETRTDTRGRKQPAHKKTVAPPEQPVEHQSPWVAHGIEPCTEDDLTNDDNQTIWRRGLAFRAREAIGHAAYEDWSEFTVDDKLVQIVEQAAAAWSGVADYLNRLRLGQRPLANDATASNDDGFDIPDWLRRA